MHQGIRQLCLLLAAIFLLGCFPAAAAASPSPSELQTGRINGREYHVKTSGYSVMYYLANSAGRLVRVSAPYVSGADGTRYYPVNNGGTVLFPVLENGTLSTYCRFIEDKAEPVLEMQGAAAAEDTTAFQTGSMNSREYYAKTSGSSMKFYLKNSSGTMVRVSAPYVTDAEGNRYYPVNCGGTVLFPEIMEGALKAYVVWQDGSAASVLEPAGHKEIVMADGAEALPSAMFLNDTGSSVSLAKTAETESLKVGDVVTDGYQKAYKVEGIVAKGDVLEIQYTQPELYEIVDSVDIDETGYADFAQFEPAPGVEMTTPAGQRSAAEEIELEIPLGKKKEAFIHFKLKAEIKEVTPKVKFRFEREKWWQIPKLVVEEASLTLDQEISFTGGIKTGRPDITDLTIPIPGAELKDFIEVGKVPIAGCKLIGGYLSVDLKINASGTFEFTAKLSGPIGCGIVDGQFKNLSKLTPSYEWKLGGEAKIGPRLSLDVVLFDQCIMDAGFTIGGAGEGSVVGHPADNVTCLDAALYMFFEITALERSFLGEQLKTKFKVEIWDKESSPWKGQLHFENMERVDKCRYEGSTPSDPSGTPSGDPSVVPEPSGPDENHGVISGLVANAKDHSQGIAGAEITVTRSGSNGALRTVQTDQNGHFSLRLEEGLYNLRISAPGYIPFECLQDVTAGETTPLETLLIVQGQPGATGTIGGTIVSAVSGEGVGDVRLEARAGWNMTEGTVLETTTTDSTGVYQMTLPLGNYTLLLLKNGYVSNHLNVAVTEDGDLTLGGALTPIDSTEVPAGELRVVLTWGWAPDDLDAHLTGPTEDGSRFHTYFGHRRHVENGVLMAALELDDIYQYGPETTTVFVPQPEGTYSFYVHNFSDDATSQPYALANSGAQVTVIAGDQVVDTFYIPSDSAGNVWHVFDYDAAARTLCPVNTFSWCDDPRNVGSDSMVSADIRDAVMLAA